MSRTVRDGRYYFDWLPTQLKVLQATASMKFPNILFCGGFGNGKSRLVGEIALQLSSAYKGIEILFWRKTRASIKDTTYRIFEEQVLPPEFIKDRNKSNLMFIDKNGSRYDFLGLDKITRKGSYWGDVALIDESIELEEAEIRMIEGRLRSKHIPVPLLISVTNPGAPGCFWHREYVDPRTRDAKTHAYFEAASFENTNNPQAYFDRLERWKGTQYYDRYVLGKWTAYRGSIYEMFDPDIHVVKPFKIRDEWEKYIAVDFGYDHPLVILWLAKDPTCNRFYVYRQFFKTHCLVRDAVKIARTITEKCGEKIEDICADHDAENRAQFEEYWRETTPAVKDVSPGIQKVQEYLLPQEDGKPGIMIFDDDWCEEPGCWYGNVDKDVVLQEENRPTCLQDELPKYKWGKNDKPVKIDDDGCDALRYGVYTYCIKGGDDGVGHIKENSHSRQ